MTQRRRPQQGTQTSQATGHRGAGVPVRPAGDVSVRELLVAGGLRGSSPAELLPKRPAFRCSLPGRAVVVVAEDVDQACDIVFAEQGVHPYEVVAA